MESRYLLVFLIFGCILTIYAADALPTGGELVSDEFETSNAHTIQAIAEAPAPVLHWYVDDGCHTEDQWGKPGKIADDYLGTFQPEPFGAGVRCCSDDGTTCNTIGKCPGTSTHSEAKQVCIEKGMRLCTKSELLTEICCKTGGNCDNHPVWTSTSMTHSVQENVASEPDCSCSDKTYVGHNLFSYGNCDTNGWYRHGPLCYVKEPSNCHDLVTDGSYYPEGYSWEACEPKRTDGKKKPLWMEKWMCKNNTEKGQQTQLRCQEMCEGSYTPECVGISYNLKTYECFLCFDHILTDEDDDYGEFFEIPKPVHCKWDEWVLGDCSATCGVGTRTNTRTKLREEAYRGTCTGQDSEIQQCQEVECPIHCEWSPFEIGECSLPCGGGMRLNNRTHDVSAEHGGEECEGPESVEESCNTHECPVDCTWTTWMYAECSTTCGEGTVAKTRSMNTEMFGGLPCEGSSVESELCNVRDCPIDLICHDLYQHSDVGFIMDVSGSVRGHWADEKRFVMDLVRKLDLFPNGAHAAVTTFSSTATLVTNFQDHTTNDDFESALEALPSPSGGTEIGIALDVALKEMFQEANGMRLDSPKAAVLITDGESRSTVDYAGFRNLFRGAHIKLLVVGIGKDLDDDLLELVETPDDLLLVTDFAALDVTNFVEHTTFCEPDASASK